MTHKLLFLIQLTITNGRCLLNFYQLNYSELSTILPFVASFTGFEFWSLCLVQFMLHKFDSRRFDSEGPLGCLCILVGMIFWRGDTVKFWASRRWKSAFVIGTMFCTSFLSHDVENLILKLAISVSLFAKFLGIQRVNVSCHLGQWVRFWRLDGVAWVLFNWVLQVTCCLASPCRCWRRDPYSNYDECLLILVILIHRYIGLKV